jgi:hypothetical protein
MSSNRLLDIEYRLSVLEAQRRAVARKIREIAPDGNYCKRCCSTDVAWIYADGKNVLIDYNGKDHVCPLNPDVFPRHEAS